MVKKTLKVLLVPIYNAACMPLLFAKNTGFEHRQISPRGAFAWYCGSFLGKYHGIRNFKGQILLHWEKSGKN
jgi:hypothetical protein